MTGGTMAYSGIDGKGHGDTGAGDPEMSVAPRSIFAFSAPAPVPLCPSAPLPPCPSAPVPQCNTPNLLNGSKE